MSTASSAPRIWLTEARSAAREGAFPEAVRLYDHFFEHALENDPSFYGVRLSYCLGEWAELGKAYPPALDALVKKKDEALQLLAQTRDPERFKDFSSICQCLDCPAEPVRVFHQYHLADNGFAATLVHIVWGELIAAKAWETCSTYLVNVIATYERTLEAFDMAVRLGRSNSGFGDPDYEAFIDRWYVKDVGHIGLVLRNTGRELEAKALRERVLKDLEQRDRMDLIPRIDALIAR